jgi:hypothetical protein
LESPVCLEAIECLTQRVLVEGTAIARSDERFYSFSQSIDDLPATQVMSIQLRQVGPEPVAVLRR